MTVPRRVSVGALNVAASPHTGGVYENALRAAADVPIALDRHDMAKLTQPEIKGAQTDKILLGRILLWTEIDKSGKWLNIEKNTEATDIDKKKIVLPANIKPNIEHSTMDLGRKAIR